MAVHKFECGFTCRCGNWVHWEGTWERVCIGNELVTVRVTGRGRSFDTVVAQSEWGDFICIPSHNIGFRGGNRPADSLQQTGELFQVPPLSHSI